MSSTDFDFETGMSEEERKGLLEGSDFDDDDEEFIIRPTAPNILPEGIYPAVITGFNLENSSKGNPMYVWEFRVTAPDFRNKGLKAWTALTDGAMWKVNDFLAACGIACPPGEQQGRFRKKDILNKAVYLKVVENEYFDQRSGSNKTNNKVDELYAPDEECIALAQDF